MHGLKFKWKDDNCANQTCPALFEVDGGHIVVGKILSADELAQVRALGTANDSGIGDGETAVFLPANVLDRLKGA